VRSKLDSARPSVEVIDQFFEEYHRKSVPSTSGKLLGFMQDSLNQTSPSPVLCSESILADDVGGPGRLLVDLDDQTVLCRRQSAAVIEQVFDAMDVTQQQRDPRAAGCHGIQSSSNFSSVLSVQYYYQGSLHGSVSAAAVFVRINQYLLRDRIGDSVNVKYSIMPLGDLVELVLLSKFSRLAKK